MTKKIKVEIEAEFGSDFQAETHEKALMMLLETWASFMMQRHSKNSAIIRTNK